MLLTPSKVIFMDQDETQCKAKGSKLYVLYVTGLTETKSNFNFCPISNSLLNLPLVYIHSIPVGS